MGCKSRLQIRVVVCSLTCSSGRGPQVGQGLPSCAQLAQVSQLFPTRTRPSDKIRWCAKLCALALGCGCLGGCFGALGVVPAPDVGMMDHKARQYTVRQDPELVLWPTIDALELDPGRSQPHSHITRLLHNISTSQSHPRRRSSQRCLGLKQIRRSNPRVSTVWMLGWAGEGVSRVCSRVEIAGV